MLRHIAALGLFAFIGLSGFSSVAPAQEASTENGGAPATSDQAAGAPPASAEPASQSESAWRMGTALIGEPKYAEGFTHFDYVNPQAPKGGLARFSADGTFDTLNFVVPKGTLAAGASNLLYDTLMTPSYDEASSMYGLLAEAMRYPDDFSSVTFRLRPEAKFHDGAPITPEDVVWSFEVLTKNSPQQQYYYRHVTKAEVTGPNEVTFTFDETGNRELPHIVGQLTVLPKHWWEGTDAQGNKRDVTRSTLEWPLGSGPYRIKRVVPGRTIAYERVPDYWAKDLPVNVGQNNFDELRWEYFRDDTAELEAFKGDQFDWRVETSAKNWATAYDFPAVRDGRVKLEMFPDEGSGVMVGFIPNQRRDMFADPRVRQALDLALDFAEMNRVLFFDQYQRIDSYFFGTELAAKGVPEGAERAILEEIAAGLPAEDRTRFMPETILTTPYVSPTTGDPTAVRDNLRKALSLLQEAGWKLQGRQLVDPQGKPFRFELLLNGPTFERVALLYKQSLAKIGIEMSIRSVDASQFQSRVRSRDFDMIYGGWGQSLSPGNEQLAYFGTQAADHPASQNYGGIKNPAVEAAIQRVVFAKDRDDLIAATKALDRILLWNHYIVPGWTLPFTRVAVWDRFGHAEPLPMLTPGFPTTWWWDEAKAAKVGRAPQ
jgi:microcin C transport system substrate-binding protein